MIITEPNEFVAEVHYRMPVLLTEKQFDPWLSGEAGVEYFKPAPNDFLQKWPVSKRVNSSRANDDDSTLIEENRICDRLTESSMHQCLGVVEAWRFCVE